MPRVPLRDAITTRDTIANLWALAEAEGELHWRVRTRAEAYAIRNKLYAYRSQLRRSAFAHTGIPTCTLDQFKPTIRQNEDGYWYMSISRRDVVDLEILVPREPGPPPLIDEFVLVHGDDT